ncbi:UNVERIFIED_CONTAM: hypothetical protein FKN15_008850 [Acipenser sinensis]
MGAHLVRSYVTNPDTEPDPLKPAGDGSHTGADECGSVARRAARLLRSPPPQTNEVQERQLAHLPSLQA